MASLTLGFYEALPVAVFCCFLGHGVRTPSIARDLFVKLEFSGSATQGGFPLAVFAGRTTPDVFNFHTAAHL